MFLCNKNLSNVLDKLPDQRRCDGKYNSNKNRNFKKPFLKLLKRGRTLARKIILLLDVFKVFQGSFYLYPIFN